MYIYIYIERERAIDLVLYVCHSPAGNDERFPDHPNPCLTQRSSMYTYYSIAKHAFPRALQTFSSSGAGGLVTVRLMKQQWAVHGQLVMSIHTCDGMVTCIPGHPLNK